MTTRNQKSTAIEALGNIRVKRDLHAKHRDVVSLIQKPSFYNRVFLQIIQLTNNQSARL